MLECERRITRVYHPLLIPIADKSTPREKMAVHQEMLVVSLKKYAFNTCDFIEDFGWAPDPVGRFGSRDIPEGRSPKGMVPLLLFKKNRQIIEEWDEILEMRGAHDFWMDKCRQVAATTFFGWWAFHKWLYRKATMGLFGTYSLDLIDKGGKGQRDATSLFGRFRMFLDAFMWSWSLPTTDGGRWTPVKFNQHMAPETFGRTTIAKRRQWALNLTGMTDSDDTSMKLVRPRWIVCNVPIAAGAEGNVLLGDMPGDAFGRSHSPTYSLSDEFPHYNKHIGAGTDVDTYTASVSNTKCRFFLGTPPRHGGSGTMMHRIVTQEKENSTRTVRHFDWTDLPVYLQGSHWICPACDHPNDWDFRISPGDKGIDARCSGCTELQRVTRFNLTSPWYRETCERMLHDKVGIAAEVQRDWGGVVGDRFFSPWNESTGIQPYRAPGKILCLDGFDPGHSVENPASWISAALDPDTKRFQIIGYFMAAGTFAEWWAPFIKRWHPRVLERVRVVGGKLAGTIFKKAFDYDKDALEMMERMSEYPLPMVGGDKSGTHQWMSESPYDRLADYGIFVHEEYTKDREALVRKGREWSARMTIDEDIAELQPISPLGQAYPSLRTIFQGAKPRPYKGQGEYKLDVDKQEPAHVIQACDAWFYLCRLMEQDVRAHALADGSYAIDAHDRDEEPVFWGGGEEL